MLCLTLVFKDGKGVSGRRGSVESEDRNRHGRSRNIDFLTALVHHCANLAAVLANQNEVAYAKRTSLHEDGGHVSAALIKGCLDYRTLGKPVGVGLEVENFGLEQHFFKKLVYVESLLGRDVLRLDFAAPIFNEQVQAGKLFLDALGVGVGAIDLVDGKNDGYVGRLSVANGLLGLGHH